MEKLSHDKTKKIRQWEVEGEIKRDDQKHSAEGSEKRSRVIKARRKRLSSLSIG